MIGWTWNSRTAVSIASFGPMHGVIPATASSNPMTVGCCRKQGQQSGQNYDQSLDQNVFRGMVYRIKVNVTGLPSVYVHPLYSTRLLTVYENGGQFVTFTFLKVKNPIVKNKNEEFHLPASDIPILVKIEKHFFHKNQIRSVARFGKGSKLTLTNGDEIVVNMNYDKVKDILE
jgi:hypothetical protein